MIQACCCIVAAHHLFLSTLLQVVLIAHSQGTIIAGDLLRRLQNAIIDGKLNQASRNPFSQRAAHCEFVHVLDCRCTFFSRTSAASK